MASFHQAPASDIRIPTDILEVEVDARRVESFVAGAVSVKVDQLDPITLEEDIRCPAGRQTPTLSRAAP